MFEDFGGMALVAGAAVVGIFLLQRLIKLALLIAGVGVLAFAAHAAGLF